MTTISSPQDTGRSPHDFGTHGVQDLRAFLRACRLPHTGIFDALKPYAGLAPSPAMLIRSHANHALQVRSEAWRRLDDICLISSSCDLKQTANQWLDTTVPLQAAEALVASDWNTEPTRSDMRSTLTSRMPMLYSSQMNELSAVLEWIDLAVVTATRVIHHMYPESSDWAFVPGQSDPRDDHIFRHCVWTVSDQNAPAFGTDSVQPRKRQVVLAYQCPWVLDQGDLADFASSQTVQHPLLPVSVQPRGLTKFHLLKYPAHLLPDHAFPASLSSHNKLWAKLWDTCHKEGAHWFILTTYEQWIFGGFSKSRKHAFVSPIFDNQSARPSVIEMMTFWLGSAMECPGAYTLPELNDETEAPYATPATVYDILFMDPDTQVALCQD